MPIYSPKIDLETGTRETLFKTFIRKENYENIFFADEKNKLFDFSSNVYYGKLDDKNNPIILNEDFLVSVASKNNVARLCDVAAKAFSDLQDYFAVGREKISSDSNFIDLFAAKGYTPPNFEYSQYMKSFYNVFAASIPFEKDREILNINNFFNIFIDVSSLLIKNQEMPITRTGFLASSLCSPNVSGLVIDLYLASPNDDRNKYDSFIKDKNFVFYLEAARRFNFKVDKNIPWRLIFSITDANLLDTEPFDDCGAYREMGYYRQFGLSSVADFFEKRYFDAMIGSTFDETTDLYSFKSVFLQMYNTYVVPNKILIFGSESPTDREISTKAFDREIVTIDEMNSLITDERWLKLMLYLRALETKQKWNQTDFNNHNNKMLVIYKNYGLRPALFFINKITRNFLDVDRTSNRVVNRNNLVNEKNSEPEGFRF